jgi:nicotinic acetylcholine receptor alpha-10
MFKCLLFTLALSNQELDLKNDIFDGYNKYVRPVEYENEITDVEVGLAIQNLENFDQMKENIALNVWMRQNWKDNFLNWDENTTNIQSIALADHEAWVPDIELLNAANLPEIYTLEGGMLLYSSGEIMWSKPGVFTFSCPLDLHDFPFDTQTCKMKLGPWTLDDKKINLMANRDKSRQLDVMDSFSHSEWKVKSFSVSLKNSTRLCCPDSNYNYLEYVIELKRHSHYYKLNMGMTISLVLVSFIIMLMEPSNVSRTGTAVFIPLTILALQLTLASKIPVVGYYTTLDRFFVACFVTSMICSIESGIVYALLASKSKLMYKLVGKSMSTDHLIDEQPNMVRNVSYNHAMSATETLNKIFNGSTVKTIAHDNNLLHLTETELHIEYKLNKIITNIDNVMRVVFPVIFFSYLGTIYN